MPSYAAMDNPTEARHPMVADALESTDSILKGIDIYRGDIEAERQRLIYMAKAHDSSASIYRKTAQAISKFLGDDQVEVTNMTPDEAKPTISNRGW